MTNLLVGRVQLGDIARRLCLGGVELLNPLLHRCKTDRYRAELPLERRDGPCDSLLRTRRRFLLVRLAVR